MSDAKAQQEPSTEEILASIRRIISEDGEQGEPASEEKTGEEILDLVELREEEPVEALAEPEPESDLPEPEAVFEPEPDPVPEPAAELQDTPAPAGTAPVAHLDESLLAKKAAQSAEDSFANLAAAANQQPFGNLPLGMSGRTLEDLVKEVMRPMIKEWLDANLPGLVERLVGREIDRLSRRGEDR